MSELSKCAERYYIILQISFEVIILTTTVRALVELFKKEFKVKKLNLPKALEIAKSLGFKICYYNSVNNETVQALIDNLKLTNYYTSTRGFTYSDNDRRIIFIRECMTEKDTLKVITHELSHIFLNHIDRCSKNCDKAQEEEADEFARLLLKRNSKTPYIITFTAVIICLITILSAGIILNKSNAYYLPNGSQEKKTNTEIVVVTRTGTKYHLPDCRYVENKTDTEEMTVEEALSKGLGPCQVCKPGIE